MADLSADYSLAMICLIVATTLIALTEFPVAYARKKLDGAYDNRNPRMQQARLTGFGARALGAHQNTIEAFPVFAAGLLLALWSRADSGWVNGLAALFIATRLIYIGCYLADLHWLRSLVWMVGFATSIGLMLLPLLALQS
ncbi:MAG: MAPEG family protein [Pseudomonadota bacterium]